MSQHDKFEGSPEPSSETTSKSTEVNPKYKFIEDPGHGWLRVPVAELVKLGIDHLISGCSYISKGGTIAYLEEDCDLSVFCRAKGWKPPESYLNWQTEYQENTFVRRLPAYPAAEGYSYKAVLEQTSWIPDDAVSGQNDLFD